MRVVVFVLVIALLPLLQTDITHGQSPETTPRFLSRDETIAGITRTSSLLILLTRLRSGKAWMPWQFEHASNNACTMLA